MRVYQAKEQFRLLAQEYFGDALVTFSQQSRVAKPSVPLVTITPGNVRRPQNSVHSDENGRTIEHYLSRINMQVDLFTNGLPVVDEETGRTVAYENFAVDDMLAFADFLNSQYVVEWSRENDVTILIDGDVQDLTGVVNDNNYEFRSRMTVLLYFTQKTTGKAGASGETPVRRLTGEFDESGNPIYKDYNSSSVTSIGGSEKLSEEETGYITGVEIIEEEDTGSE